MEAFSGADSPSHPPDYHALQTSRAAEHTTSMRSSIDMPKNRTNAQDANNTPNYRVVSLPQRLPSNHLESNQAFCSNVVITSKYTTWNFLPKFMLESFRKLANAYFLLVSVLQCIPAISNTGGLPSNSPVLLFILSVDAVLAIIEDRRRHRADNEANSATCHIITRTFKGPPTTQMQQTQDPDISVIQWSELTVGTIVKLHNRETAPADLLILSVDEPDPKNPNGICYVETKSLDGETNLKLRHACDTTLYALSASQVASLQGYLRCENPNKVIGRFDGTLMVQVIDHRIKKTVPLAGGGATVTDDVVQQAVTIKNVILRGCQLRNTDWMYGLVINTGPDTKIMQSAAKPRPKWSSINETVNRMIIWLFILLCVCCAIATTRQVVWLNNNKTDSQYLMWYPSLVPQWFIGFGYYFLLMYQMIPVSLYVTISMVMFIQAIFMTWDIDMYFGELDQRMIVRSMGLNEELGQISYVFSDKTGTLTCNVMEFRKCSINGISYGTGTTEVGRAALKRKGIVVAEDPPLIASNKNRRHVPYVNFEDPKLCKILEDNDRPTREAEFFLHLSLCQTVIPERIEGSDEVRFSASSPDEQALVSGAKFFGFSFESRGLGVARVRVTNRGMMVNKSSDSELWEFKILEVLEFTSDRKRMSVIVEYPDGELWALVKGADNMIYPLLSKTANDPKLMEETMKHLELFGDDGLRTLTIARRRLDPKEYAVWSEKYKEANASLEEIEKRKNGLTNRIDELMAEIERDLVLLGATAIEDKLQDNVPRAIANLMKGGMKVWMLTGDKQETAINIAYACQLMDNTMTQLIYNCELFPEKEQFLANLSQSIRTASVNSRKAVVIDGECLEVAFADEQLRTQFLKLAMTCDAVVCCRVSPSQKAEIVRYVRRMNRNARTLAIGDGANDVAMIQRAHVGVGICGQEGMQAVNSSDYAIGQFCFLEKLLLHHGRLNYKRMSILVGYMFYKNIVMVLSQYFYMFCTGASGQKFYSEFAFQLYNICYTSLPIIVLGVFDYDVPWEVGRKFPQLYLVGPRMELFNTITFFKWIASAIFESAVIFLFSLYGFNGRDMSIGTAPMVQYGVMTFTLVVLVCNLRLCNLQMSWSVPGAIVWFIGVVSYLPASILASSYMVRVFPNDFGSFRNTLTLASYWFVIPVACVVALLRHYTWTVFQRRFYPEPWQIVQEQYVLQHKKRLPPSSHVSSGTRIDIEASGIPVIQEQEQFGYQSSLSPAPPTHQLMTEQGDHESDSQEDEEEAADHVRVSGSSSRSEAARKKRISSGYAFSFDPPTTMAESYISTHSVASAASAISEAETRNRVTREESRASDFEGRMSPTAIAHVVVEESTVAESEEVH